jgi:hypothetical protein
MVASLVTSHLSIAEFRADLDLRTFPRLRHAHFGGLNFERGNRVLRGIAIGNALRDPTFDDFVVSRILLEAQAAAMGYLLRGLSQHQAARRFGAIEPAAGEIVEQGLVVELRVVAAQRQLESVLAFGRAVARTRRAARLVQNGRDIAQKRDGFGGACDCYDTKAEQ